MFGSLWAANQTITHPGSLRLNFSTPEGREVIREVRLVARRRGG